MAHTTITRSPGAQQAERSETDKFTSVWARMSSADRLVLLGHDRDELSGDDKVRLARVASELARQVREGRTRRRPR